VGGLVGVTNSVVHEPPGQVVASSGSEENAGVRGSLSGGERGHSEATSSETSVGDEASSHSPLGRDAISDHSTVSLIKSLSPDLLSHGGMADFSVLAV